VKHFFGRVRPCIIVYLQHSFRQRTAAYILETGRFKNTSMGTEIKKGAYKKLENLI